MSVRIYRHTILAVAALLLVLLFDPREAHARTNELLSAINSANTQRLANLLANGHKPNQLLADFSLPLSWAVEQQNPTMVRLLLSSGAEPDLEGSERNSFSPLLLACLRGNEDIIHALLEAGADVNRTTREGIGSIALCAGHAPTSTLVALHARGAGIESSNVNGQSPLMFAAANARVENLLWLLDNGADINRISHGGFSPLFFALKSKKPEPALLLIEKGADVGQKGQDGTSVIQLAMYQHQYQVATRLLDNRVDLEAYDRNGDQLLHAAVKARQPDLVRLLIQKGAKVNAETGESKVVWRYEVNFTAAPFIRYSKTPLLLAAESGSVQVMQMLLDAGADPSFKSADGNSLLHVAAHSKPDALAFAIKLQPDVNLQNALGQTALHRLLNLGTDKETSSADIATMLRLLADTGVRIDIEDQAGLTALEIATSGQNRSKTAFLGAFENYL